MEQLAEKHCLQPCSPFPWVKNLTGGSDDHSSLTIARRYTEMDGITELEQFLTAIEQNEVKIAGPASTPMTLAHNVYSIAYQFYHHKFDLNLDYSATKQRKVCSFLQPSDMVTEIRRS
jgi:hypothetical protein